MPFPNINIPPPTIYSDLIDKLQRFFNDAMKYWRLLPAPGNSAALYLDSTGHWSIPDGTSGPAYPVGIIILTENNTNPSTLGIPGTWESV